MTNDKQFLYNPLKRLGFSSPPSTRLARSTMIMSADEKDLHDVWNLCKFHQYELPYKDAVEHIIRNPRNVSALSLVHVVEVPATCTGEQELVGTVTHEEVAGFVCVAPVDVPCLTPNMIQVRIPLLVHNLSLGEEQVANMLYECLHQYAVLKTTTDVPTKLEVTIWLTPHETTFFKTVVAFINALFHDSYLPLRVADVGHETWSPTDKPKNPLLTKPNQYPKAALLKQRRDLNNPALQTEVKHTLTFPRLPGPMK